MTSGKPLALSVVLPSFNEGEQAYRAIACYAECRAQLPDTFELLAVDDCSEDDTHDHLLRAAETWSFVRVLRNERNLGQAGTILRGFAEARGAILFHNAADLSFDPQHTPLVMERFARGADVVVVQRTNRLAYGVVRTLLSWTNVAVTRLILRSPVTDHNFTQAYRREVIDAIQVETTGVSTVTTELVIKAYKRGFRVDSLRLRYGSRMAGRSSVTARSTVHSALQLLRLAAIMRSSRERSR